jgi:hypothetical protein
MIIQGVHKIHQLYDELGQVWFDLYEAIGIENRPILVEVPREVRQPSIVRAHLLRNGAQASAVDDTRLAAVIAAEAPVVRRAASTGWRDNNLAFVSHHFVAPEASEAEILSPTSTMEEATGQSRMRGTLEGWQHLAKVAQHSTAMTTALCATFAAPLLRLTGRPSFALVLFGPTRTGKSTVQLVAGSALGFGREQDLPSLNATSAGLSAAGLRFNDHMLPINEIGTAPGPKREVYVGLRDTTYSLMHGRDTLRHPSWTGASGAAGTFQVICVLSSEFSPDAWAARNGETRDEGEMARLIGVPVLASGHHSVFDRPPSYLEGRALLAWEKLRFQRLREGLPNYRGVAFREYLDFLCEDLDGNAALARELIAWFEGKVGRATMSPVARDIVAKFGVLFAGGILAVDAGVLPLERKAIYPAIRRACLAALAELPDPAGELRSDLATLKDRLTSGAILDLDSRNQKEKRMMHNADGFRRQRENANGTECVVRAQVFAGWFGTVVRARRVLEWLADEGFLDHARDKGAKRSNEWAQKQVTWPDGTRVRSISVYFPAGLTNLDSRGM